MCFERILSVSSHSTGFAVEIYKCIHHWQLDLLNQMVFINLLQKSVFPEYFCTNYISSSEDRLKAKKKIRKTFETMYNYVSLRINSQYHIVINNIDCMSGGVDITCVITLLIGQILIKKILVSSFPVECLLILGKKNNNNVIHDLACMRENEYKIFK